MTTNNNNNNHHPEHRDGDVADDDNINDKATTTTMVEEEYWPTMINSSLQTQHQIHTICFENNKILRYKSISVQAMTPLDMIYDNNNQRLKNRYTESENDVSDLMQDEYYDGTGNLMWMAAVCGKAFAYFPCLR